MAQELKGDVYRALGEKIDNLTARAPWNETFHSILKELYTVEEADVVVRMPYTLSSFDRISKMTKVDKARLSTVLEKLCNKGLVMDVWNEKENQFYYVQSPIAIGIFEFTMMRKGGDLNTKEWAKLFHKYMQEDDSFYAANFSHGEKLSIMRVIPIEETIKADEHMEFFDYEKASSIIDSAERFSIGQCSCRVEKSQIGEKECDAPLEACSSFGMGADFLIKNNMARAVSKSEMIDNFARSKELGLVFCAVNTKKNPTAICHCCKCCCGLLAGWNRFGYANSVVTSNFISTSDEEKCKGCGKCVDACPVNAMSLVSANDPKDRKKKKSHVNPEICIGCGLCASRCSAGAIEMKNRGERLILPETIFEMTLLSSLERGTLQNQLFDNPQSITQKFMRSFVGGFLKLPPVKKALMSEAYRSTFLNFMRKGAEAQGKGWMTEM